MGRCRVNAWGVATGLVAVALFGRAEAAQEKADEIVAVGQSVIYDADTATARDRAIDDALRKAIEQAVGAMVSSETVTENYQLISDKILSQSKGYVKRYKIDSEGKQDGQIYQVTVRAEVSSGPLKNDLDGVLAILKAKNMPRMLLMVSEQNVGQPGASYWWGGSSITTNLDAVENAIINTWIPKGISFVDRQAVMGKFKVGPAASSAAPTDNDIKEFAGNTGAEVVVIGKAVATDAGPIMGTQMHSIRGNLSARALDLDTGRILGTVTVSQVVGHIDPVTGGTQALTKVGEKAAAELLEKVLGQWQSEIGGVANITLVINDVPNASGLRKLVNAIKEQVRGVQDVRQRSFAKKVATLEVAIKGSARDLEVELEAKKLAGYKLEVEGSTANTVTAALKK